MVPRRMSDAKSACERYHGNDTLRCRVAAASPSAELHACAGDGTLRRGLPDEQACRLRRPTGSDAPK